MTSAAAKRGKITDENREEAAKLLAIWNQTKADREARGVGSQEKFGAEFGIGNQAAVGFFLNARTALSPKAAAGFARGMGCSVGDFSPRLAKMLNVAAGWTAEQHTPAGVIVSSVAQDMSHLMQSHTLLEITWESLVAAVPDSLFVLPLRDDALAPDHPAGRRVVWRKDRPLKTGRLVLLRDKHGADCARMLHDGPLPGQWVASASHRAFMSFDVPSADVTVLAVHQGFLEDD